MAASSQGDGAVSAQGGGAVSAQGDGAVRRRGTERGRLAAERRSSRSDDETNTQRQGEGAPSARSAQRAPCSLELQRQR